MQGTIQIYSKTPELGAVKTRLAKTVGKAQALQLYVSMVEHVISTCIHQDACGVELWVTPTWEHPQIKRWAVDYDLTLYTQPESDLGQRLQCSIGHALQSSHYVVVLGGDSVSVDSTYLYSARRLLEQGQDMVLGPADDGGFVLLALSRMRPGMFNHIDWGTDRVLEQTLANAGVHGMKVELLEPRWDVDTEKDLPRLSEVLDMVR